MAVIDHVEELQRKCIKHVRKPYTRKIEPTNGDDGDHEKDRETKKESRQDRLGNISQSLPSRWGSPVSSDEAWLEKHEMKIAVLLDRNAVDPLDYGGRSYDEYVSEH